MKYSISEFDGRFAIMVEVEVVKGMWWWKKKSKKWERANAFGGGMVYGYFTTPVEPSFPTIDAAIKKVKSWQKGVTIHQI